VKAPRFGGHPESHGRFPRRGGETREGLDPGGRREPDPDHPRAPLVREHDRGPRQDLPGNGLESGGLDRFREMLRGVGADLA
jgi:hypothetical protein